MGKSSVYYFIARNTKTNKFDILSFGKSLEEIDLYTIKYENKDELLKFLITKGKINSMDTDIYIGIPKKNDEGKYVINCFDVLYSDSKGIEDIANGFLNKNEPTKAIDGVLDKFVFNMKYSDRFYSMIVKGKTSVFPKFINYFKETHPDDMFKIKYKEGAWPRKSYPLIRNIFDANSKFNSMDTYDMVSNDVMGRKLIEEKILERVGKGNKQDQMSLFDYDAFNEENNIEHDNKLLEITNTFDGISRRLFKFVDRKVILDTSKFNDISGEDLEKLKNLLGRELMDVLYHYYNHKNFISFDKNDKGITYDKLIEDDQKKILELLKNKTTFNNAYSWIMIYNKYMLGEEYGRQKIKGE